jgi:NHS family xanthosine MFS transporter
VIDKFFTYSDNSKDWHGIWISFSLYALVVAILFLFLFKHKHNPELVAKKLDDPSEIIVEEKIITK